jgi:hypothetical protein
VFNHAAPHEGIRRVEKNVPGELLFRNTGTVNYVDRLGSAKTGSITLSSANQNIEDEINITKRGRELDGTHIRVLGAHEGEAQFFANLVPSDDSANYDNRVDYTTSRWSDGDTRDWDRFVNKDVTDQATIEEEAAELGTEITERLVEATATTTLELDVGDTVQVVKPDAALDRAMRVHRIKEHAEGGTVTRELVLSTRTIVRSDESDDLRDIERFNSGFQGSSVVVQGGGSRQPVDASNNAEIPFFYPDLEFENKAELFVRGLQYRHYSVPNEHAHEVTHPAHSHNVTHPSHDHDVSDTSTSSGVSPATHHQVTNTANHTFSTDSDATLVVTASGTLASGNDPIAVSVFVDGSNEATVSKQSDEDFTIVFSLSGSDHDANPTVDIDATDSNFNTVSTSDETIRVLEVQTHTHDVSISDTSTTALGTTGTSTTALGTTETSSTAAGATAGIEETTDTPTGVDVQVDGSTVATDIGTGTFQTTVDLSGELTKNAWNLIELTSDDLGHIQGTVSIRGYDQIGKN